MVHYIELVWLAFPPGVVRTERNATNWSSDKLKELLLAIRVENDQGSCEVTEVSKVEGEASINNRKGKLIFFYEWNLKAKWKGETQAHSITHKHVQACVYLPTSLTYTHTNTQKEHIPLDTHTHKGSI